MSGCYGSDPEDQYFENKLMEHIDVECFYCVNPNKCLDSDVPACEACIEKLND